MTPEIIALAATLAGPASFDDFQSRYVQAAPATRAALARAFVDDQRAHGGFPIIEPDGAVVFVYVGSGAEKTVAVIGDFKTKNPNSVYWDETGEPLARIAPDAPVFWRRFRKFERDARLDYQLAVDGKFMRDPLNGNVIVSGAAPSRTGQGETASVLQMPSAPSSAAVTARPGIPVGRTQVVEEAWASPKITVYLPPGYAGAGGKDYPVLFTTDGRQWRDFIGLPAILDNAIADGAVEPMIAVMIDSAADRADWYQFNPAYLTYLARVMDYVDSHYATRRGPAARLHAGSSAGGRASLQVGLALPGMISNLALLSPSLTAPPHIYEPLFTGRRRLDRRLRVWLSAGTYEGYIHTDAQLLERTLRTARVPVTARYTHEGHSFGTWRHLVPDMLAHFFPPRARR